MTGVELPFGRFGEITPRTITAAGLTGPERDHAYELMELQSAYLSILNCLTHPVGPDGMVHSLSAIQPTRLAIAYTLALCGFRQTGTVYEPKGLPRYGAPPALPPEGWHTEPTITVENVPRGSP